MYILLVRVFGAHEKKWLVLYLSLGWGETMNMYVRTYVHLHTHECFVTVHAVIHSLCVSSQYLLCCTLILYLKCKFKNLWDNTRIPDYDGYCCTHLAQIL